MDLLDSLNKALRYVNPVLAGQDLLREDSAPVEPLEKPTFDYKERKPNKNNQTVYSKSFNIDGVEVLLPTIDEYGWEMDDETAVLRYKLKNEHLGKFKTPEEATEYAKWISAHQVTDEERKASEFNKPDDRSIDFLSVPSPRQFDMGLADPVEVVQDIQERSQNTPVARMSDEQLYHVANDTFGNPQQEAARNELNIRRRFQKQSVIENLSDLDYIKRNAEKIAEGVVASPLLIPSDTAFMGSVISDIPSVFGFETGRETAEGLRGFAETARETAFDLSGATEPENFLQSVAQIAPSATIPVARGKQISGTLTNLAEVITPFTIGGGTGRQIANVGVQTLGNEVLKEALDIEKDNVTTLFEAGSELLNTNLEFDLIPEAMAEYEGFKEDKLIGKMSDGTPIYDRDFNYGILGLATVGAMFVPGGARIASRANARVKHWLERNDYIDRPSYLEPIDTTGQLAPSELINPMTQRDYLITNVLSDTDGHFKSLERVGLHNPHLEKEIRNNTGASLGVKLANAVENGDFQGLDITYKPKNAVNRVREEFFSLNQKDQDVVSDYITILDNIENIRQLGKGNDNSFRLNPNSNDFDGVSLTGLEKRARQIEKDFPAVKKFADYIADNNEALIRTMSTGEHSPWAAAKANEARKRPHYFSRLPRPEDAWDRSNFSKEAFFNKGTGRTITERANPFENLDLFTESMLRDRMDNSVRAATIENEYASPLGRKLYRKVKDDKEWKSIRKEWKSKAVKYEKDGKVHRYITNQGFADYFKLQPNYAAFKWASRPSRLFQFWTTGPGNPMFAPKRFLRDGWVTSITAPIKWRIGTYIPGTNIRVPIPLDADIHLRNMLGLAGMTARQIQGAGLKALERSLLRSESGGYIARLLGKPALQNFVSMLDNNFKSSVYYSIVKAGNTDVSLAKRITEDQAEWVTEAFRNSPSGRFLSVLPKMYTQFINNVQNAPTHVPFARNLKRVMKKNKGYIPINKIEEMASEFRPMTGDPTVTGKSYVKHYNDQGQLAWRPFGQDPYDKNFNLKSYLRHNVVSAPVNVLRELAPWTNAMIKGVEQLVKTWWKHPYIFTYRTWVNTGAPVLFSYSMAMHMGEEYYDYMVNKRNDYMKATHIYFPPAWKMDEAGNYIGAPYEGIEVPMSLEVAPIGYMFFNALDHFYRPTDAKSGAEMANVIFNTFFDFTMPPIASAGLGLAGVKTSNTILGLGEDTYMPEYNAASGWQRSISHLGKSAGLSPIQAEKYAVDSELFIQALFASSSHSFLFGFSSMIDAKEMEGMKGKEADLADKLVAGAKGLTESTLSRFPLISDAKMSQFTEISDEFWEMYKFPDRISAPYYNYFGKPDEPFSAKEAQKEMTFFMDAPTDHPGMISPPTLRYDLLPVYDQLDPLKAQTWTDPLDGKIYLVPTMKDGETLLTIDDRKTKEKDKYWTKDKRKNQWMRENHFGQFDSIDSANAYLQVLEEASQGGEVIINPVMDALPEMDSANLAPPIPGTEPTNWLWWENAERLMSVFDHKQFNKAYKDDLKRIWSLNENIKRVRSIKPGQYDEWKRYVEEEMKDGRFKNYMRRYGDKYDAETRQNVLNDLEYMRQNLYGTFLGKKVNLEKRVERDLERMTGERVEIDLFKHLDPWGIPPIPAPPGYVPPPLRTLPSTEPSIPQP